jgi:hypothetical protein
MVILSPLIMLGSRQGGACHMSIAKLIEDLEHADEPSRQLDLEICFAVGYKRQVEYEENGGEPVRRIYLTLPSGNKASRTPCFTSSLTDAFELVQTILPGSVGGVVWKGNWGRAQINDGEYCEAANPPMALCLAALKAKLYEQGG